MWNTKGHNTVVERLEAAVVNHNVSHAYIFYGSRHVGKMTCALDVARGLNCINDTQFACGECVQCSRIQRQLHADIHIISPENSDNKTSIGIRDVRDILHVSNMKPYEGSYRITIIDDADLMTLEASNALLKTLEEPADQNVFFLITSNEEALIPTIKSRCQSIYFSILNTEAIKMFLRDNYDIGSDKLDLLTSLCSGRLGWAIQALNDENILKERATAMDLFWDLFEQGLDRGFEIADHLASEYYKNSKYVLDTLDFWSALFRDLLIIKKTDATLVHNIDVQDKLSVLVDSCSETELTDNILFVLDTIGQLQSNVIPRLCLDNLIMKLNNKKILGS